MHQNVRKQVNIAKSWQHTCKFHLPNTSKTNGYASTYKLDTDIRWNKIPVYSLWLNGSKHGEVW